MRAASVLGLAGGFAYGVERGGGDLMYALENGFGQDLFHLNLPHVAYDNVNSTGAGTRLARLQPDFVFGCPPCAGWSTASAGLDRKNNPDHPINDGIRMWFAAVENTTPTVACFESVVGCLKNGRGLWYPLARRLEEVGYRWSFLVYDNQDCGVPQRRERMLFWAWRNDGILVPEQPPRPDWRSTRQALEAWKSGDSPDDPWWAWQELDPLRVPVHRLLPYVPCGSNVRRVGTELWLEHYHEPGVRDGWPSFTYRRLHPDRPAPVMMANALTTIAHYDDSIFPYVRDDDVELPNPECRLINGRELAILMGYPPDFRLRFAEHEGSATRTEREHLSAWLTQAVSPAVGMWAARVASVHLEDPWQLGTGQAWQPLVWDLRRGNRVALPLDSWAPV